MIRPISKDEFILVYSFYHRWINKEPGIIDVIAGEMKSIREKNIQEREKKASGQLVTGKIVRDKKTPPAAIDMKKITPHSAYEEGIKKAAEGAITVEEALKNISDYLKTKTISSDEELKEYFSK